MSKSELYPVPLTMEGSSVLHQMLRVRWFEWRKLPADQQRALAAELAQLLTAWEQAGTQWSALYSLLGHKGEFMLVHFRDSFDALNDVQTQLRKLKLWDYLELTSSYVSVVELGLYDSSLKLFRELQEKDIAQHSEAWNAAVNDTLTRQKQAMKARLFPELPANPYICFYPMDRRRGEEKNWYTLPIEERQRQMDEHGQVGRRYAGIVKQIITGSIGFDDWEWGVTLWADDPLQFKKLIYEMRFDHVSAVYALFGTFYFGLRLPAAQLGTALAV